MLRGLGHKPDEALGLHVSAGPPPRATPASSMDLSRGCRVLDQWTTQACVGYAIVAAAEIAVDHAVTFSPVATYTLARIFARTSWTEPLLDDGAYPLLATKALQKHGFLPDMPLSINDKLYFDRLEAMYTHRLTSFSRIPSGPGAYEMVRGAIASGNAVTLAIAVDESFESTDGRIPIPPASGSVRGSHYITCVGYGPSGAKVLNSWGKDWGNGGYAWLTPERVEQAQDLQVIDVVEA